MGCEARRELGSSGTAGAYGEYLVVPGRFVHRLPAGTDLRKAVLCGSIAETLRGLRLLRATYKTGNLGSCAVVGGGPRGHLCALILKNRGMEPSLYTRDPEERALAARSGMAVSEDYSELGRFPAVVETTGDAAIQNLAIRASQRGASLLFLGEYRSKQQLDVEAVARGEKIIMFSAGSEASDLGEAIDLLPRLDLSPLLQPVLPLREYKTAWKMLREKPSLRLLIEVDPELQRRSAAGKTNGREASSSMLTASVR